jgi:uncharacterized membrane protein YraQ (UPF0718 family)
MKQFQFKGVRFLLIVVASYLGILLVDSAKLPVIWSEFVAIWAKILPIFALIIILTTLTHYFLKPKHIIKHLGEESGVMGMVYAIIGGILSHGPMYVWYGMLEDMREHGLRDGLIATFLYARAVKLPLLPFMIGLFGVTFTVVINLYILLFAILQGKIVDKIICYNNLNASQE